MIVGTAGHVDHGKTALVKALTGVDADRLKEEKARGITIDLGFAYRALAPGRITGFVDVPGHERFVHTMLAGASGIDFALLVVAADDGVMPQTREHLAILDLLGLERGLVALTKVDLVDAERRAAASAEIRAALAPTALRDAPVLPVSSASGEGLDCLRAALAQAERDTVRDGAAGRFRLSVDRCFSLTGTGTVVTGTVLSGTVGIGDRVLVSPRGLEARVRSIHAENRSVARGTAGQRCALNLAGEAVAKEAIVRGDVVLDPLLHAPTDRIDAMVRLLPSETKPVREGLVVRFHQGSVEAGARLLPLEDPIAPGGAGLVQLVLDRRIAATGGDRFVLRDASAQRTIGGGRLLDLRAPARKRRTLQRLAQLTALRRPDLSEAFAGLLAVAPFVVDYGAFARDHALAPADIDTLREAVACETIEAGGLVMAWSPATAERFSDELVTVLASVHAERPEEQGIGREQLRLRMPPRLPPAAFVSVLQHEARAGRVVLDGAFVRLPTHSVRLSAAEESVWERLGPELLGAARFRPPRVRDLASLLGIDEAEVRRVLKLCTRLGRLDQIAHDHFFARATTGEMVTLACDAASEAPNGAFTAAAFRDRMNNGRKVAIQILDFFDRHGITIRSGDLRRINPHRRDVFGTAGRDGRESSPVGRPDFKSGWDSEPVPGGFDTRSLPPAEPPA